MENYLPVNESTNGTKEFSLRPFVIFCLIFVGLGIGWKVITFKKIATQPIPETLGVSEEAVEGKIVVVIRAQNEEYFDQILQAGDTVWSVLKRLSDNGEITVESQQFDFGVMVTSINGISGEGSGKYWMYYVNDQLADKGSDQYTLKAGDTILWSLE